MLPAQRFGRPDDVADVVAFFCSDAAALRHRPGHLRRRRLHRLGCRLLPRSPATPGRRVDSARTPVSRCASSPSPVVTGSTTRPSPPCSARSAPSAAGCSRRPSNRPRRPGCGPSTAARSTPCSATTCPGWRCTAASRRRPSGPDPEVARALADLLDAGQGFVFLHHALAGWPGWPGWADVLGGRYHYAPAVLRGDDMARLRIPLCRVHRTRRRPDASGVRGSERLRAQRRALLLPGVRGRGRAAAARGRATRCRSPRRYAEVLGTRRADAPGSIPPASDLIAWAKTAGGSPIVYIQPGDGPATFAVPTIPPPARQRPRVGGLAGRAQLGARTIRRRSTHLRTRQENEDRMDLGLNGRKAWSPARAAASAARSPRCSPREGCDLALCARGKDTLEEFAGELRGGGRTVVTAAVDVADEQAVAAFVEAAARRAGRPRHRDQQRLRRQRSRARTSGRRASAPTCSRSSGWPRRPSRTSRSPTPRRSSRVGTTSAFDTLPPTSPNSYAALKAAVLQHASGLGHSLAPKGIRVNTVSPGPIDFPGGAWDKLHEAPSGVLRGHPRPHPDRAASATPTRSPAPSPSWPARRPASARRSTWSSTAGSSAGCSSRHGRSGGPPGRRPGVRRPVARLRLRAACELLRELGEHEQVRTRVFEDFDCARRPGARRPARHLHLQRPARTPAQQRGPGRLRRAAAGGGSPCTARPRRSTRRTRPGRSARRGCSARWPTVLGNQFLAHPPIAPYTVQVTAPEHPLVAGIEPFEVRDELYVLELHPPLEVLLHARFTGAVPRLRGGRRDRRRTAAGALPA